MIRLTTLLTTAIGVAAFFIPSPGVATESKGLDELIEQMSSEDRVIRRDASYRLSQMGLEAKTAVPVLIKALEDRDDQIWFNAITALARIGPDAREAIPALIRDLEGGERGRNRLRSLYRTAFALGSIGPAALPAIKKTLAHERSNARAGAAKAMTWIGPAGQDLIPDLVNLLGDADEDVRDNTAEALGAIGTEACASLFAVLRDNESSPRSKAAAASALGWIAEPKTDHVKTLAEIYPQQTNATVQAALVQALDKWRYDPKQFLTILIAGLHNEDSALREASTDALLLMYPPSETSVPALSKLLHDGDNALRERVIRILGALGRDAQAAVGPLENLVQDQSLPETTRRVCREALAAIKP